jgi:hypothetical protein
VLTLWKALIYEGRGAIFCVQVGEHEIGVAAFGGVIQTFGGFDEFSFALCHPHRALHLIKPAMTQQANGNFFTEIIFRPYIDVDRFRHKKKRPQ